MKKKKNIYIYIYRVAGLFREVCWEAVGRLAWEQELDKMAR